MKNLIRVLLVWSDASTTTFVAATWVEAFRRAKEIGADPLNGVGALRVFTGTGPGTLQEHTLVEVLKGAQVTE